MSYTGEYRRYKRNRRINLFKKKKHIIKTMKTKDRSYYEKQKETFANEYNNNRDKKWGEKYGYTLEPPMQLETIEKYEKTYDLQIPSQFRNYLLNISSETIGGYPYKVILHEPISFFIHESKNYDVDGGIIFGGLDDKYRNDIKKLNELGYYENYFIYTHENGCTDDDLLCVKGPKYGRYGGACDGGDYFSCEYGGTDSTRSL